ncbi:Apoptosis inhibitor IAP [Frankliniella fusca]|uniref:Apoptosis inhibitor IAP n=1 Tax=Frankliniella fusca TaxID=407009 RepID=A0AAE1H1L4_9NEOP|nr:Apoptosis inhibitor IAP [Frankliniella fusca]
MDNNDLSPNQNKTPDEMDGPNENEGVAEMDHAQGVDECGMYNITPCSPTMDVSLERLGICPRQDAAHPSFTTLESRMESFSSWPLHIKLRPDAFCDAGFYYTGKGDKTVCFQCGGGLKDWEENDDPWKEHARYFSKCTYLIQKKGRDFINEVLGKNCRQVPSSPIPVEVQSVNVAAPSTSSQEGLPPPEGSLSDVGSSGYGSGGSFGDEPSSSKTAGKPETKTLNDQTACKICYAEEIGVVFLPCGHLVSCVNCAPSLKTCAVCRKPFSATVRAYLS